MSVPRIDQFQGCLIGQCLGDAVGFPVEGYPPLICQRYTKQILERGQVGEWTHYPYVFGQYSDDSQLSRELMLSFLHCQRFDPEDYAHRIASMFKNKKIIGYGKATAAAANQLIQGIPWTHSGVLAPSAGNGSAMRAAPIGLFFFDDPDMLLTVAYDQSRITHQDARCSAGAVTIAGAVALLLQTEELSENIFLKQLSEWAKQYDETFAQFILNMNHWLTIPIPDATMAISQAGADPEFENGWQGISPFVISSVLWSLYAFLKSPQDYWQTINTAIAVGGDVDTTAAMAGALSGAYLGIQAIPEKYAQQLTDQGTWGYSQLLNLANQCFEVKMAQLLSPNR